MAFTPDQISGLIRWLDSDVGTSTSGSALLGWQDNSPVGSLLLAPSSETRPTLLSDVINGHAAVWGPDTARCLLDASLPPGGAYGAFSLFFVLRALDVESPQLLLQMGGESDEEAIQPQIGSGIFEAGYIDNHGFGQHAGTFPFTDTSGWHILAWIFNGSLIGDANRSQCFLDGVQQTLSSPTVTVPDSFFVEAGCSLGIYRLLTGTNGFHGYLANEIMYSVALPTAEHAEVGTYLADRYGLQTAYNQANPVTTLAVLQTAGTILLAPRANYPIDYGTFTSITLSLFRAGSLASSQIDLTYNEGTLNFEHPWTAAELAQPGAYVGFVTATARGGLATRFPSQGTALFTLLPA